MENDCVEALLPPPSSISVQEPFGLAVCLNQNLTAESWRVRFAADDKAHEKPHSRVQEFRFEPSHSVQRGTWRPAVTSVRKCGCSWPFYLVETLASDRFPWNFSSFQSWNIHDAATLPPACFFAARAFAAMESANFVFLVTSNVSFSHL